MKLNRHQRNAVAAIKWIRAHEFTAVLTPDEQPPPGIRELVSEYLLDAMDRCVEETIDCAVIGLTEDYLDPPEY